MRLDAALIVRSLAPSRARAKEQILAGEITVNGICRQKPAFEVGENDAICSSAAQSPFVGRGGFKLACALAQFPVSLADMTCLDIGASTGGFTDCMLQNGAERVFALDVGHGQLAQSLRDDPRVINLEGTNIRTVTTALFGGTVAFISIDVSFISLTLVLPTAYSVLSDGGAVIALIKPQFEAGRAALSKNGVVKSPEVHAAVLQQIADAARSLGFSIQGCIPSAIRGGSGNREYLIYLCKNKQPDAALDYRTIVQMAFTDAVKE